MSKRLHGYPFSPKVVERANCGPTVLASLIGEDTDKAMELMDRLYKKSWNGYTNIGHIKAVLNHKRIAMNKTKEFDGLSEITITTFPQAHVLLFLQIEGPWEDSKYWRAAYTRTHWVLGYAARILDVNNTRNSIDHKRPRWEWVDTWQDNIMPRIAQSFENSTGGWHVRSAYYVEEMKE